jgi:two-component system, LuxR family, sensor kinase FixL
MDPTQTAHEEPFRGLLEAAPDAIVIVDAKGAIALVNGQAEKMFGRNRDEMIGQKLEVLMPERFRGAHVGYRDGYMQSPHTRPMGAQSQLFARRKNGSKFPVDIMLSPWETARGTLVIAVIRDITERKRIEEALRRSHDELDARVRERTAELARANEALQAEINERQRLESEILGVAETERRRFGHDLHDGLSQHLAGIEFLAQSLEQKLEKKAKRDAAKAGEIARYIREAIVQTRMLAHGLSPVALDSDGLMSALHELAATTQKVFGIACAFERVRPVRVADHIAATHLYRIAQEAINNAIKHGRASRITIALDASDAIATLRIRDNGSGFSAQPATADGMGLRIMKYRAGMFGGALEVRGIDGDGTEVVCTFKTDR